MTESGFGKLAILVGGGPAPGINGVIASATIDAINYGVEVFGIRDGYQWLAKKDIDWSDPRCPYLRRLTIEDVSPIALRGGSYLGTSRNNPTKKPEDMERVLDVFKQLGVRSLVTIGGDDTAYSASQVYKQAGGAIRVAHVPKTIDNDLPLPGSTPTFGFETARHVGTYVVRNLAEDATHHLALVPDRQHGPGRRPPRPGHRQGRRRHADHHPRGVPQADECRSRMRPELCDIIIGAIIKRRSAGPALRRRRCWPRA